MKKAWLEWTGLSVNDRIQSHDDSVPPQRGKRPPSRLLILNWDDTSVIPNFSRRETLWRSSLPSCKTECTLRSASPFPLGRMLQ